MNEFKTYHPVINFLYFSFVIVFSCAFMHPVCLFISLACGFTYSLVLKGIKSAKKNLLYIIPMIVLIALINPLFNHQGQTILFYLPTSNPFTLESVFYGICSAIMIASVILWFFCYNKIMTSDKFIYLFGRIIPSLSMIISMTLRFAPKFSEHLKEVTDAQKCMGQSILEGSLIKRAKCGLNILSAMTTWALENAVETADSMKSRGYGLPCRTSYSIFTFDKRDKYALILILIFAFYTLIGSFFGGMYFNFFPSVKYTPFSVFNLSIYISYFLLCIFPVIIEILEVIKWNVLKSKI